MELDIKLTKIWKSSLVIIQALGTLTQKELIEENGGITYDLNKPHLLSF